jgi:hypothetical protein
MLPAGVVRHQTPEVLTPVTAVDVPEATFPRVLLPVI